MIKVNYKIQLRYKGETYTFNMEGVLPVVPRKDEIIEINKELLKVANISYIDNSELITVNFAYTFTYLDIATDKMFEHIKKLGFKEES